MTCLGIWSLKVCHSSTCLGIRQSQGSQEVITPQSAQGPSFGRLSCLDLPGDLHPDPGMPGSQVATVLGRISFRKTQP